MKTIDQRATSEKAAPGTTKQRATQRRRIGPYSRLLENGCVSGRTTIGRYIKAMEHQLAAHCGGKPTVIQRMLIRRLSRVAARLELFDQKLADGKGYTEYDSRTYAALHNNFRLLCREIGIKGPVEAPGAALRQHIESYSTTSTTKNQRAHAAE